VEGKSYRGVGGGGGFMGALNGVYGVGNFGAQVTRRSFSPFKGRALARDAGGISPPKSRGRPPSGKAWDAVEGKWMDRRTDVANTVTVVSHPVPVKVKAATDAAQAGLAGGRRGRGPGPEFRGRLGSSGGGGSGGGGGGSGGIGGGSGSDSDSHSAESATF
jgi:hypothetical protein